MPLRAFLVSPFAPFQPMRQRGGKVSMPSRRVGGVNDSLRLRQTFIVSKLRSTLPKRNESATDYARFRPTAAAADKRLPQRVISQNTDYATDGGSKRPLFRRIPAAHAHLGWLVLIPLSTQRTVRTTCLTGTFYGFGMRAFRCISINSVLLLEVLPCLVNLRIAIEPPSILIPWSATTFIPTPKSHIPIRILPCLKAANNANLPANLHIWLVRSKTRTQA